MVTTMSETKLCKNCKYFVQHYAKRIKNFATVWCGHCIITDRGREFPRKPNDAACKRWEQAEPNNEKQQNSISELLQKIYKQLRELTQVLSADN